MVKPDLLRAKAARSGVGGAVVSGAEGGQIKRDDLGVLGGGSPGLSKAFGLRPVVRQGGGGGFEHGPSTPEKRRRSLIVGRSGIGIGSPNPSGRGYGGASGADDTCSFDPFEDTWSPRRDELSAVELPDVDFDRQDSVDDLDPFQGLQV